VQTMSKDLNKILITGRLGKDVELRVTPAGKSVASFSVASSRGNSKDGGQEQTEWFRVVAWEKLAEICANFLKKGSKVLIEGRLQTREYTDKDGIKRYQTEIIATDMIMLGEKRDSGDNWDSDSAPIAKTSKVTDFEVDEVDVADIPF
jgi:single-strand DNA-binding protein